MQELVEWVQPGKTSLLLGAGASIPSGGPSWTQLAEEMVASMAPDLTVAPDLPLVSEIVERRLGRRPVIDFIRDRLDVDPVGGISTIPMFPWRAIYSTNYDRLVEKAATAQGRAVAVVRSKYDLPALEDPAALPVLKIHGCITQDRAYGDPSSLVLTKTDYRHVREWKGQLLRRMQISLETGRLLIVGHGLGDPHLDEMVDEILGLQAELGLNHRVAMLLHKAPAEVIELYAARGFYVVEGDVDWLMSELLERQSTRDTENSEVGSRELAGVLSDTLAAITVDVASAVRISTPARKMFAGAPATYYDIIKGRTFERDDVSLIINRLAYKRVAVVVGNVGQGKTTLSRQVLMRRRDDGVLAWEHRVDLPLDVDQWMQVEARLRAAGSYGCLLLDNAHGYMRQVNDLARALSRLPDQHLELLIVSEVRRWRQFMKHPSLVEAKPVDARRLSASEIQRLSALVESSEELRQVVPSTFLAMSDHDRRSFLRDRCRADVFICLKNLFASTGFDQIILSEVNALPDEVKPVYALVAALESITGGCHRQMVLRLLELDPANISTTLDELDGLMSERLQSEAEGIYIWRTRHPEIAHIVTAHYYGSPGARVQLLHSLLTQLNPTIRIEANAIRGICNSALGLDSVPSSEQRIILLERLLELSPRDHVIRHRIVRELIRSDELTEAENALDAAVRDVGIDPPLARYRVDLLRRRAAVQPIDRVQLLEQAWQECLNAERQFSENWYVYRSYCEVARDYLDATGDSRYAGVAARKGRSAIERLFEPQLERHVREIERLVLEVPSA